MEVDKALKMGAILCIRVPFSESRCVAGLCGAPLQRRGCRDPVPDSGAMGEGCVEALP